MVRVDTFLHTFHIFRIDNINNSTLFLSDNSSNPHAISDSFENPFSSFVSVSDVFQWYMYVHISTTWYVHIVACWRIYHVPFFGYPRRQLMWTVCPFISSIILSISLLLYLFIYLYVFILSNIYTYSSIALTAMPFFSVRSFFGNEASSWWVLGNLYLLT